MVTEIEKTHFAAALNKQLDKANVPRRGRARFLNVRLGLGLSDKACKKWLDGETFPTLDKLFVIARYFGFSIDEIASTGLYSTEISKDLDIDTSSSIGSLVEMLLDAERKNTIPSTTVSAIKVLLKDGFLSSNTELIDQGAGLNGVKE
ncbi:MAG: hypothetical protein ABNH21_06740 [Glaciecola sp.]|jgi:uncharacterized ubiquitin-like protein YukD